MRPNYPALAATLALAMAASFAARADGGRVIIRSPGTTQAPMPAAPVPAARIPVSHVPAAARPASPQAAPERIVIRSPAMGTAAPAAPNTVRVKANVVAPFDPVASGAALAAQSVAPISPARPAPTPKPAPAAHTEPTPSSAPASAAARPAPKTASAPKTAERLQPAPEVVELDEIGATEWRSKGLGNVREAPTTASRILGTLRKDEAVTVLGRVVGTEWHAVDFGGKFGFIHESIATPTEPVRANASAPDRTAETAPVADAEAAPVAVAQNAAVDGDAACPIGGVE